MKTVSEGSVTATVGTGRAWSPSGTVGGTRPQGEHSLWVGCELNTARTARGSNITKVEQGKKL